MIKSLAASKTAQLLAACVCPVVGTVALTTAVPQVRSAVHKATAPRQYAKPKTRVRPQMQTAAVQPPCVDVGALATQSIAPLTPFSLADGKIPVVDTGPGPIGYPGPGGPPIIDTPSGGGPNVPPPGIVPEPGTWLQLVLGFGVIGMMMRGRWGRVDEEDAGLDSEKA
jgi:hypothetical protein